MSVKRYLLTLAMTMPRCSSVWSSHVAVRLISGLDLYNTCSAVVGELPLTQRTLQASHFLGRETSPNEAPLNVLNPVTTDTWKGPLKQFLVPSSIAHLGSTATSRTPTGGIYAELGLMEAELFSQSGLLPTAFNHLVNVTSAVLEIISPLFLQFSLPNYLQNLVLTPGNYLQMRDYSTGCRSADAQTAIALLKRSLASSPFPLVTQLLGGSSPASGTSASFRTLGRLLASEQRYGGGSRRSFDATEESSEGGHGSGSAAARAGCLPSDGRRHF